MGAAASLANAVRTAYEEVAAERASQAADRAIGSIEKIRVKRQAQLDASSRAGRRELDSTLSGHVLTTAELMGIYER